LAGVLFIAEQSIANRSQMGRFILSNLVFNHTQTGDRRDLHRNIPMLHQHFLDKPL